MIDLAPDVVTGLPLDELALLVLADLVRSNAWNAHNYLSEAAQSERYRQHGDAVQAIAEAMGWLRSRVLIGRKAGDSSPDRIVVTRAGHAALADGLSRVRAEHRLQDGLHPLVEEAARPQFLLGEYELAVFAAMKAVEIRVRRLGEYPDDLVGVQLMNKAFGAGGPLVDSAAPTGEQDGMRFFFAGAFAVLRNPPGHREVDYSDVAEAAEAVTTASLLMRMLDRIEERIS